MPTNPITIILQNKERKFLFPYNPEHINIVEISRAIKQNIVSTGQISIPTTPELKTCTLESLFWYERIEENNSWYWKPRDFLNWLIEWQHAKIPMRFTVEKLNHDFWVICENLEYDVKAGEEDDIYFKIELLEFRPYGAKIIEPLAKQTTNSSNSSNVDHAINLAPARVDNKATVGVEYTILPNDTLWSISKKLSAKGGTDWQELYNANLNVIGANPNLIHAGITLIIPESWRG